jgi:YqeY-like protein|nr:MAG TPA: YqeY-like protein [Caudoviricetes sp.]
MNLYQEIKKDLLIARKNKNELVKSVLSVVLAEADKSLISRLPENEQQELMLSVVLKAEKQYTKAIEQFKDNQVLVSEYENERQVLFPYLPKPLTEFEIKGILEIEKFANLGLAMKYFSQYYKGRYQPQIIKALFELN